MMERAQHHHARSPTGRGGLVMPLHSRRPALEIERVGTVTVARFIRADFIDEDIINTTGNQLFHLVEELDCRQLLLNFARVKRVSSAMLGKVIWVHKKLQGVGGQLALCNLDPTLQEAFQSLQLNRLFRIYAEEQEALQSFP
jgi:anti-anti-sigma factor